MRSVIGADREVARLAERQHRIVLGDQLRDAGLSWEAIRHRVGQTRLRRLWRGVYVVGPAPPDPLSWAMGAVLSCNGNGVLSHRWAGWLWGFMPQPEFPVDVLVERGSHRARERVRLHRARTPGRADITRRRDIPVTTPARTLIDLAAHLTAAELERAAGLPVPETNVKLLRYEADFVWRAERLIVEVDGYATHGHRGAFEHDRRREAELIAAGWTVMRVTWTQLTSEPVAVAARLAAALALRGSDAA